ncbi:MAG: 50S ribosomal protein L13 [Candidatus ainarchaeum sp.]|nr:50S ribosomal protein L13 [Candidatus ainarchaeum sp.]MDD3085743.1 50S ribosomal protein L13 [Candidatus ainarchaeum sp.]MDD4128476.1 50S ribosomal protein L13 [Candidatus ainarchaeum sp.]
MMIVDAKDNVAGRLASKVAKAIINGERVTVINSQDLVIVGNKKSILEKFTTRVDGAVKSNPHYGPKYDRIPSKIFRRMVRNMLPTKKRAKERIIKQLRVFNTTAKGIDSKEAIIFEEIKFNHRNNYIKLKDVALLLGGRW